MDKLLLEILHSPLSVILGTGGIIFLFLALIGQVRGKFIIDIPPERQKGLATTGAFLLMVAVFLYVLPLIRPPNDRPATPTPPSTPTPTQFSIPTPMQTIAPTLPPVTLQTSKVSSGVSIDQAVRDYYALIQQKEYALAWEMSKKYNVEQKKLSFDVYISEWEKSGPATIVEPLSATQSGDTASVMLTLYYSKKNVYHTFRYDFIRDPAEGHERFGYWLFVKGQLLD